MDKSVTTFDPHELTVRHGDGVVWLLLPPFTDTDNDETRLGYHDIC